METSSKPKKRLGQYWLDDETALNNIVNIANIKKTDIVVEIGPGMGSLTTKLIHCANKVIAVEVDEELVKKLKAKFKNEANLNLIHGNILTFDLATLPKNYLLVANIPYYLTSNLVRKISESSNPPTSATLLLQKEIAQRIAAKPGNMSLLSITAQYYWRTDLKKKVPSILFKPPPKVDSQIIKLIRRHKTPLGGNQTKILFNIVRGAFNQKRKKIFNSLSVNLGLNKETVIERLTKANIDPNLRPQELVIKDWISVYKALLDLLSKSK